MKKVSYLVIGMWGSKVVDALSQSDFDNAENRGDEIFKITAETYEPPDSFMTPIKINVTKHECVRQSVWREVDGN